LWARSSPDNWSAAPGIYRIFPILGAGAMTILCGTIAAIGLGRFWPLDTLLTAALGLSFGFQLPTVIVPVQNALDLEDAGIGLSVVMFSRLIGGAFGVALLTALLVGELNSGALAIPGHDVLGTNPGIALLPRSTRAGQPGPAHWLGARGSHRVLACLFVCRGYFGADHGGLVRIEGDPAARQLNSAIEDFDLVIEVGGLTLPG
jgi:hypothetical protein